MGRQEPGGRQRGGPMERIVYKITRHENGWAYKVGDVLSETFPTRDDALSAARSAAARQRAPGETGPIEYEDEKGRWHEEISDGHDRPETSVE